MFNIRLNLRREKVKHNSRSAGAWPKTSRLEESKENISDVALAGYFMFINMLWTKLTDIVSKTSVQPVSLF